MLYGNSEYGFNFGLRRPARVALSALLALPLFAPAATHAIEFETAPTDQTFYTGIAVSLQLPAIKTTSQCYASTAVYGLSPALPAGLSFDGGAGQYTKRTISGTPTTATAQTEYTLSAHDPFCTDPVITATFKITVLVPAPELTASSVTSTGASLRLNNWTTNNGDYYLKGTGRNSYSYSCASHRSNRDVSISGLTGNSTYAFTAYRESTCSGSGIASATFTTPGSVSVWTHNIRKNHLDVELSGWTSGSDQWSYDLTSPTDNGSERVSGPLRCRSQKGGRSDTVRGMRVANLLAGTSYTVRAYWGAGCSALNLLGSADFTTKSNTWAAPSVAVSNIGNTGATITLSNWSDDWWYERNGLSSTCTQATSGSTSVTLSGLSSSTSYFIGAYSESGCSAATSPIDFYAGVRFTTTGNLTISVSDKTATSFTVTLSGHTNDNTFPSQWAIQAARKLTDGGWEGTGCIVNGKSRTTVVMTGLTAGQTYTVYVYRASWCNSILDVATTSTTTTSLSSSLGQGAATLSLNEHEGAWSYRGQLASGSSASASAASPPGGGPARLWAASIDQCRAMPSGTYEAELSDLAASTSYAFTAYNDHVCLGDELGATTVVTPENWGGTPSRLGRRRPGRRRR